MINAYLHNGNIVTDENNAGFSKHLDPDQHVELLYVLQWIKKEFDRNGIGDGADHLNSEKVCELVSHLVCELDPSF